MATIQQTNDIISLLRQLVKGAGQGAFGNAIFFGVSPIYPSTAKPNDIFIDTDTGIIYQFDGTTWNQQLDLQEEIIANNGLTKTDNLIELGGNLTKNTNIGGASNQYYLWLTDFKEIILSSQGGNVLLYQQGSIGTTTIRSVLGPQWTEFIFKPSGLEIDKRNTGTYNGITYIDRPDAFNSQTLPDVQYLDEHTYEKIQFNLTPTAPAEEGQIRWNDDEKTVNIITEGGNAISVGQELEVRCRNNSGVTITNGSVVYVSGAQGSVPIITLADATDAVTSDSTIGIVTEDIANNSVGRVTVFGLVRDVNTNAYPEGTILYLSETAGQFTNIPPTQPAHRVRIGEVLRQNTNEGVILVNVIVGEHLEFLHDVLIPTPQLNERISYNPTQDLWISNQLGTVDSLPDKSYTIPSNSQLIIDEGLEIEGNLTIEGRLFID